MGRKSFKVEFEESPPDDFDPSKPYKDPVAMLEMREHLVREKWIDIETAKILRDRVRWCYRVEGVNHLQKCKHLVQQYLDSTRGIGWNKDSRPPSLHGNYENTEKFILERGRMTPFLIIWFRHFVGPKVEAAVVEEE